MKLKRMCLVFTGMRMKVRFYFPSESVKIEHIIRRKIQFKTIQTMSNYVVRDSLLPRGLIAQITANIRGGIRNDK